MTAEIVALRIVRGEGIEILDQTLLPGVERYIVLDDVTSLREAIASLRIRGAPLLGLAGACGMAIAAERHGASEAALREQGERIATTRPTAVDLGAAVRRSLSAALAAPEEQRVALLWDMAERMASGRVAEDRALAEFGASLLPRGASVLTHCNTGTLATAGIGTALGVVRAAWEAGDLKRCFATETRPLLQGARLTAWELKRLGIPATLLPDTASASLLASGQVTAVITGADRVAANGDSANKVGTYGLAVLAARHGVPFYIAAPLSTIDRECPDGGSIPIEFRDAKEVGGFGESRWAPAGLDAYNPAFDVTPAELIAAIVTEVGVLKPPYYPAIARAFAGRA